MALLDFLTKQLLILRIRGFIVANLSFIITITYRYLFNLGTKVAIIDDTEIYE